MPRPQLRTLVRPLWLIVFVAGTAACVASPPAKQPPTFATFKPFQAQAVEPTPLPDLPKGICLPSEIQCTYIGFDTDGLLALEQFKSIARGNTTIASENGKQAVATAQAANELVLAGRTQEFMTSIREEQLADERKGRTQDRWYYRALIFVLLAAGGGALYAQ